MIASNFYVSSQDDTNWVYDKKTSPCKDKKNELGVLDAVLCGTDGIKCKCTCWHRAHRVCVCVCVRMRVPFLAASHSRELCLACTVNTLEISVYMSDNG